MSRLVKRLRRGSTAQALTGATLTAAALKSRVDRGEDIPVLDVRTAAEYCGPGGHIARAKNIPLEELPERLAEIEGWRGLPLAVICRTNRRSAEAVRELGARGFRSAVLVADGMAAWERHGFPTERDHGRSAGERTAASSTPLPLDA